MREILFRGKRTDNGEWMFGNLTIWGDGGTSIDEEPYEGSPLYEVDTETIGQFTGIHDKNGNRIFEGDIIAGALFCFENPKNGIVTYRDGSFGLLWHRGDAEQFNPFTSMCNVTYEVIGNIHDNHKIMEGEG